MHHVLGAQQQTDDLPPSGVGSERRAVVDRVLRVLRGAVEIAATRGKIYRRQTFPAPSR
jgi:hypothetical protein